MRTQPPRPVASEPNVTKGESDHEGTQKIVVVPVLLSVFLIVVASLGE